ncbi:DUF6612 family protein [Anaerotignum sp.]|uniref:DUF6612 family protein n=1 Tax=Anaerotignum sp. TaxID=2039241 RepID=UPI002714F620|nr:DUF6612 family protein [Anaerotignum sp.]
MKQRIRYFLLTITAILIFSGCSTKENDAATLIENARQKMAEVTSLQAKMNMNVKMNLDSEEISTIATADISTFVQPLKMKLDVSSFMENNVEQKTIMQMYVQEQGDGITAFINAGTGWVRTQLEKNSLGQYQVYDNIIGYLSSIENPENKGAEKIGDTSVVRIDGVLKGETMGKIIEDSGILTSAFNLGISQEELQAMYKEIGELPVTLWIGEDGLVYQCETDISNLIQMIIDKTIDLFTDDNAENNSNFSVQHASFSMSYSNFNSVEDFEIPEEALESGQ